MGCGYRFTLLALCLVGLCVADDAPPVKASTATWADKLKKDLLLNYDRNLRPTQYYNVTNIEVNMEIRHVDIDEDNSIFTVSGWLKMKWNDDKLKWNPDDYGKLNVIRTNPESVWRPDLVLYNNARPSDIEHYGMTNVLIYNTGEVLWVPPTDYHANCKLNLRFWPFDQQTCFVKIGSWTFDGYKLNISEYGKAKVDIDVDNNEWTVVDLATEIHTTTYECCPEPYMDIRYNVTMQRQSSTHRAIVISPAFVIMLLALSVFWLPPNCGEKIVLNGIIALIVTVFLIYFATQLPAMSGNTPLIVTFFSTTLYLVAFGTILSVIVLRMSRTKHADPVPHVFKKQLDGCLGSVLGVGSGSLSSIEDKEAAAGEIGDAKQRDWCRLAGCIDRLAFVVYLVIFIISAVYHSL
ncbi:acetylcholine receptor subunit alpha-like 1 isoform X2 [Culex pipiens pallens]|uniref:acetylcholine receptor subunit alpha-like 1 isoform X2 n=1 Tax=Culex pipiens pallens TaxID=42434 RepID=UPI00195481B3|nr:acetylcholine receptor subunit alpha-like 1 isoform X2 [Culex pipiens pallens]